MHLYNLTLQKATKITHAIQGNFSGTKQQEIVVSRGKVLEILKPDPNTGKIHTLVSEELFGIVRCLVSFRQTGSNKDYIIVGSDSGRIVILEYEASKNAFKKVHQETFGKSGFRRTIPGQYLAVDPKGRSLMICAVEKQKLVYILNRDAQAHLTISSPLEAHKNNTILYDAVGVDVGFENPTFACLEFDYEECDIDTTGETAAQTSQSLTYYELDLGLNHVVRKYSVPLDLRANMLITVPGGSDGPSGVLLCCENYIIYKNFGDQVDIRCPIPRRRNDLDDPERSMLFSCTATHRTKSMFFFLAQTEQGDIFKVTLETDDDLVTEVRLKYFDTVPVASSICVLKSGCLFVASDAGNHYLYQIAHLGDDDDEPEFTSSMPLDEGDTFFFAPRPLKNLVVIDELNNLCPVIDCRITDLGNEDTPQLYALCGSGPRSSLRVLKHGLEISEMAISELPGSPNAVWTVKRRVDDEFDAYIVVSFVNATLVLSIGETVEEVTDSGFLGTTPTLSCSQLGNDALVQIYPEGIRHIRADKRVNEWKSPGKRSIVKCAVNQRQVVIALSGGELVYFEMDQSGQLNEYTERKEMSADVICMSLGRVPVNEQRTRFLAVGLDDNTVRIISLDPSDCLSPLSMQALPATPESLCVVEMGGSASSETEEDQPGRSSIGGLFLNIGLQNGVLLRTVIDSVTGDLSDTRTRYLGSKAVKLFKVHMQASESVLAMSSRSWLSYVYQKRYHLTPLSYESLEYASGFASEQCPEGIVAISGNTLRILAVEKLGVVFNQSVTPLQFTPHRLEVHEASQNLIIIESDHNAYTDETKDVRKKQMAKEMIEAAGEEEQQLACEMAHTFLEENLQEEVFGSAKAGTGMWASCIRILKPSTKRTLFKLPLDQNEAAICLSLLKFANRPDEEFVVVGVAKDLVLSPRSHNGGSIHVYRLTSCGEKLELVHKTPVDEIPGALASFRGRVLVGVGRLLRLYDLGRKKLLRKCENKHIPNGVVSIKTMGDRVVVGDQQESIHFVKYKAAENRLVVFSDDIIPRWITTSCMLDYHTVAAADKFGNVFVLRLPGDVNDEVDEDPTGTKSLWDRGLLSGASQKLTNVSTFHVGENITSLQKASLIPGGSEALVYTTLAGGIGMLVPFTSHEDHDFFQHLEMHMRSEVHSLVGRDHMAFRSSFMPIKSVIDGDLCELFGSVEHSRQVAVAQDLDRNPNEVSKKLEDIRTRFAF